MSQENLATVPPGDLAFVDQLPDDVRKHAAHCDECFMHEGGRIYLCHQAYKVQSRRLKGFYLGAQVSELPRVLNDRVLLRVIKREMEKRGLLFIPDMSTEKPNEGEVLAKGQGRILDNGTRVAVDLNIGDHVFYGRYSGTELRFGEMSIIILREDELLAVLPEQVAKPEIGVDMGDPAGDKTVEAIVEGVAPTEG